MVVDKKPISIRRECVGFFLELVGDKFSEGFVDGFVVVQFPVAII